MAANATSIIMKVSSSEKELNAATTYLFQKFESLYILCRMIEKVLVHKTAFPFSKKSLNQLRNVIDCLTSSHTHYYFPMNISQFTKR